MAVGKNITWKKGKGEAILRLLGRISSGEGHGYFWGENQDFKNGGGEVVWSFIQYTPL